MKVLNENQKKKVILLVSDGSEGFKELEAIFSSHYKVIVTYNSNIDYNTIKAQIRQVSAIILTAAAEIFFRWIASDSTVAYIPLLIYCDDTAGMPQSMECLKRGAVDVISPPFHNDLLLHRIENAIRLKDSATFYEIKRMLKELPSNIYLKDEKGRYIFATHYWHHLEHADEPDWTIRGKTDVDIRKDKDNAIKAMEADIEILRSGIGTSYTIMINEDGTREFFEVIKQPTRDEKGTVTGIIGLINNVTERELLRISLEESAMIDDMTGVYNRRFFEQYTAKLEKSNERPVSIISADCNELKKINDTFGHLVGDEYIRMTALMFRMVVQNSGRIFRIGGDEFVIILPRKTAGEAETIVRKLQKEEQNFSVKNHNLSISYGVSCMENKTDSIIDIIDAADKHMYLNKAKYKNNIKNQRK
ncbi:MAG: diguanylate cyclase [Ruminococcus sp.]|nr:diguanylate cyclase [Ruminococcus sp.]